VTAVVLSGSAAQAASRCPPGTRTPAAIAWWVVVPFFISLAISAPMFAALTKSEQGRVKRLLATIGVFVTGFAITVGLFVWQVTRCVPV
jgi:type IV secretory pathway VirB2 component (pilin)